MPVVIRNICLPIVNPPVSLNIEDYVPTGLFYLGGIQPVNFTAELNKSTYTFGETIEVKIISDNSKCKK